jgi:hypothetical protein
MIAGLGLVAVVTVGAAAVLSRSGLRDGTIPAGTRIVAALEQTINTEKASPGQRISLISTEPIELADGGRLPEGVRIDGEVTHAKGGGRIAGAPELTLRFRELQLDGRDYALTAEPFRVRGKNDALESAATIGGGAIVGAVVGEIVADKPVHGAVAGAVLGTGVAVATKGDQIVLGEGQRLRVRLQEPVQVRYKPAERQ